MRVLRLVVLAAKLQDDAERRERCAQSDFVADRALQRDRLFARDARFVEVPQRREQHDVRPKNLPVDLVGNGARRRQPQLKEPAHPLHAFGQMPVHPPEPPDRSQQKETARRRFATREPLQCRANVAVFELETREPTSL